MSLFIGVMLFSVSPSSLPLCHYSFFLLAEGMYTESGILFSRFTFKKLWQVYRARDEFIYVPLGRWRAECREEEERAERGREAVVPQRANYFPKRDRKLFWYSVQRRIHVHCCEYRMVAYSRGRQDISVIVVYR